MTQIAELLSSFSWLLDPRHQLTNSMIHHRPKSNCFKFKTSFRKSEIKTIEFPRWFFQHMIDVWIDRARAFFVHSINGKKKTKTKKGFRRRRWWSEWHITSRFPAHWWERCEVEASEMQIHAHSELNSITIKFYSRAHSIAHRSNVLKGGSSKHLSRTSFTAIIKRKKTSECLKPRFHSAFYLSSYEQNFSLLSPRGLLLLFHILLRARPSVLRGSFKLNKR